MASNGSLAKAAGVPLPGGDANSLREPQAPFYDPSRPVSSIDGRPHSAAIADSTTALGGINKDEVSLAEGGQATDPAPKKSAKRNLLLIALLSLVALIVVVLAVVLPVYFKVIKPRQQSGSREGQIGGSTEDPGETPVEPTPTEPVTPVVPITGGDGSTITTENGTTFTYVNNFGGFWYSDPDDPYNDSAQPNSWTPPLNESFDYATTRIYGVNLGGLFVLEPFISPALFQRYPGTRDEWELSLAMAADTANGGLDQLEEHYDTFITEQDIAEIAGAGLNWIRLPVPYWAIEKYADEPFLERTSWRYIIRTLQWCRKYGLRVNIDLHTIPGSHNAYNHGGKFGVHNFMNGAMGMANAQRALYYIRVFTEFFNQPEWRSVVPMFSIMNEPIITTIGAEQIRAFYVEAHRVMREVTGFGEGNGPYMVLHDSFQGLGGWSGFMSGADRVGIDVHPYFAFNGAAAVEAIDTGVGPGAGGPWPARACTRFGSMMNDSRSAFGVTMAGEWSNAIQDCSLYLRGVGTPTDYQGDCTVWQDSAGWTDGTKAGLLAFASAQMDALGDYFFWTWRIGESERGIVESPFWSYKLGLDGGWMPTDPRSVIGTCQALGVSTGSFTGPFAPYMTGGVGAGAPSDAGAYPWPPAAQNDGNAAAALPTYATTGTPVVLPAPTFTDSQGNPIPPIGTQAAYPAPTPIAGCTYPNAWESEGVFAPGVCA
ncbi:glycoside hydrolase [Coprinopsis marcescibilis]|uniref:glucan 1,3-beta-glucosidase n=1 Tax=Coprinopsis marcescibilis TaxID=230819 RepID=A0A5C3KH84_COPMA|nr:glycoside hydrolase [Coprinopsis marcescibilis]